MSQGANKVLVIYKSKYGSTKRYAQWIAEETNGDLIESSKVKGEDLKKYDTIVFGGFLHAVGISGVKIITENFKNIADKRLIVFAVGCTPEREKDIEKVFSANLKAEMRGKIQCFYLRGAFNYESLDFVDKMMMNALKIKLKKIQEEDLDEDAKGLLECYDNPVDWTDKKFIQPIVKCINEN
ncbi:flavodoxin domain-containing protein [Clostridium tunisiense]|uniref:flavodoxin domain-containing protein n=1 Tax=Clostridium tunisiense TaxID=219748 RepID=UPI0003093FB0|nr:flavodoxin domain-containing protein [Clostridium tunisiense]